MKYNFFTGENGEKVKYKGYKYLRKGKLGKLKTEIIEGKKVYYDINHNFQTPLQSGEQQSKWE